ncbi:SUKH-4 family immunity protein [Actinomadura sp. WMMB 499]|uniref:SUKH-4 family immunity protein n=1 Tax=Actinomadura sp. WMMB 499 TaxID=1219491 RepID=UPI00159E8C68|nr:SUKH-4 family immunity protein [Actinomadura sp. WMMB 499]
MTTQDLVDAFGDEDVRRFGDGELPTEVVHTVTRRFLTTVGIPTDLKSSFLSLAKFEPLPETHARESAAGHWTWDLPDDAKKCFVLGGFFGGDVALDGADGKVFFIPDGDVLPQPMHSGIDALAYFMYALQRDTHYYSQEYAEQIDADPDDERDADDVLMETAVRLARELMEVDRTPFTVGELPPYEIGSGEDPFTGDFAGPWTGAFMDISAGEWD